MNLHLKDKTFIVTGGSKGIGAAITQTLFEEGSKVMIATRSREATEQLIDQIDPSRSQLHSIIGDLKSSDQCRKVIEETVAHFGSIDGIVNNAGMNDGVTLEDGPEAFRKSLELNLYHYYDLVHYALPYLKTSKGSIVNISSKVALTGQGATSGYAAAKSAQLGLTREWAAALLEDGVRVNAVLPAEVMTPLYRKWLDNSFEDPAAKEAEIVSKIPLGKRMTSSQEIASMTVFLLSDQSAHTTGQFMIVDGGYVHLDRSLT